MQQTQLDELTHEQLRELCAKKEQEFYVNQGKNESNINAYLTRIFTLYDENPGFFEGLAMPCGRTAKEVVPAMYETPFNLEAYNEQRKVLLNFSKNLSARSDDLARKALAECL